LTAPLVPASVLTAHRTELSDLALQVAAGALPPDLAGHLFFVAPVGTVSSGGLPYPNPTTIMNGDGMVVRVDFASGSAAATSRIVRTWDQRADELTHATKDLELLRFVPAGIARIGLLGARDFANTAFQPMAEPNAPTRLLVTYDAGRPWEIDPQTLAAVTPLGHRAEWVASAFGSLPFPLFLSPAHPAYDTATRELFTVNYVRSPASLLGLSATGLLAALPGPLRALIDSVVKTIGGTRTAHVVAQELHGLGVGELLKKHVEDRHSTPAASSCDALRWDGAGALSRTDLVLADGTPVVIKQSVHQVALTREHFVILDTGFKLGVAQLFSDPLPLEEALDALLRELLDEAQMSETIFYVVRRDALVAGGTAVAQKIVIPVEADHFVADYDDTLGRVTVHVAHAPATDLAEWVRPFDVQHYGGAKGPSYADGFLAVGAMDVGRLGRCVIDTTAGMVVESKVLVDDEKLWAISLYAGPGLGGIEPLPERIESLFWASEGVFPDLLTQFVYDLYANYPHRVTPLSEIDAMARQGGRPACIVRLDTRTMTLADSLILPAGTMVSSLQFVARPGAALGAHDGWLLCVVFTATRLELWILDASDLAAPPCKLVSDQLVIGFSLHTAWLPTVAPRTASYQVPLDGDLLPTGLAGELERFVAEHLLPHLRGV